eukprot:scaffold251433_cov30-Tisochrysis_lutea.AAC.2
MRFVDPQCAAHPGVMRGLDSDHQFRRLHAPVPICQLTSEVVASWSVGVMLAANPNVDTSATRSCAAVRR